MKKLIALSLAGLLTCIPFSTLADDTDLEARVDALEERVAALEAQLAGSPPEGVTAAPDQEVTDVGNVETGLVSNNCSLEYTGFEVAKTYDDHDCVVLYFDFMNGSGETTTASREYTVTVFQNGKEQDFGIVSDNEPNHDWQTEIRSGSDPLMVAYASEIQDMSDIIVRIKSGTDYSIEPVEFTVPLE